MSISADELQRVIYMHLSTFQYLQKEMVQSFIFVDEILWMDVWLFIFGIIVAHSGITR
jgi:hypothetical protein